MSGLPILIPAGALLAFDAATRFDIAASGDTGVPLDALEPAGWVEVSGEVIRAENLALATLVELFLTRPATVPGSLSLVSADPVTLLDDGTGNLTGSVGATHSIDYAQGLIRLDYSVNVTGPITADYQHFGSALGRVFSIVRADGTPLGRGTVTLTTGAPLIVEAGPAGLTPLGRASVDRVVDPDPTAPSMSLDDPNLDQATLDLIFAQIAECSELDQTEADMRGKNLPWLMRGGLLQITGVHDDEQALHDLPPLLIQERNLEVSARGPFITRSAKGLAWTMPALEMPGDATPGAAPIGTPQAFVYRGTWQGSTSYAEFDVVRAAPSVATVFFAALLKDRDRGWSYPALSGPVNPFLLTNAIAADDAARMPVLAEGGWIPDGQIRDWFGFFRLVELDGGGQSLLVRDRDGVAHYLTYYPDAGVWTDTAVPPDELLMAVQSSPTASLAVQNITQRQRQIELDGTVVAVMRSGLQVSMQGQTLICPVIIDAYFTVGDAVLLARTDDDDWVVIGIGTTGVLSTAPGPIRTPPPIASQSLHESFVRLVNINNQVLRKGTVTVVLATGELGVKLKTMDVLAVSASTQYFSFGDTVYAIKKDDGTWLVLGGS